ncbi:GmrSD restriction endonuclease domain-containing protein [Candidatus Thiodictyon syntrophicum]|jgi:hypothetical protein|uniref:GmrSD restriction endonucleases N-terminal domain-containing protein n=1 Tax=Candidatus Thiodictyon syntrophicum TaxID=1166950 RepID=A0A2K8U6F7_9GAMM|nr:DUF262 domain-containing protein [Candidatus Thiodictyon syntrophicum]AUB81135.1 hypothetical protein THSYN_09330 [Candidatus Thiodictyon syntrophicum]
MNPMALIKVLGSLFSCQAAYAVPDYQRSYAWVRQENNSKDHQVDDFWSDLLQAYRNSAAREQNGDAAQPYYWGTITVNKTNRTRANGILAIPIYDVVDGQQRLITLSLLLAAFDHVVFKDLQKQLLPGGAPIITPGSLNLDSFNDLISNVPENQIRGLDLATNTRLMEAKKYLSEQIRQRQPAEQQGLLDFFLNSTIALEFDAGNEQLAMQAFLTLNDRGKPLSVLEKLKGTLFAIDHTQGGRRAAQINQVFGLVYRTLDTINELGRTEQLPFFRDLNDEGFVRLFYHYFAHQAIAVHHLDNPVDKLAHNALASAASALDFFQRAASQLANGAAGVGGFLTDLLTDMENVANGLNDIALSSKAQANPALLKLFGFLGIHPSMMPILVGAQIHGWLTPQFIKAIETTDVRVFKVANKTRITPLYQDTLPYLRAINEQPMIAALNGYWNNWQPDAYFSANLSNPYGRPGLKYLLWEFISSSHPGFISTNLRLFKDVTIEHVFARTPAITLPGSGFTNPDDYASSNNLAGNLSLLENVLQNIANNQPPPLKVPAYGRSANPYIKGLGNYIAAQGFSKADVITRTSQFQNFAVAHWC